MYTEPTTENPNEIKPPDEVLITSIKVDKPAAWWQAYVALLGLALGLVLLTRLGLTHREQQFGYLGLVMIFFWFIYHWMQHQIDVLSE